MKHAIALGIALGTVGTAAMADPFTDQLVQDMVDQGYAYVDVKNGINQAKVEAIRDGMKTEFVIDKGTGQVLKTETFAAELSELGLVGTRVRDRARDFVRDRSNDDDDDHDEVAEADDDGGKGRGRGRGRGRGGDDDDDRDNSGRGNADDRDDSGNSGRGGGDDDGPDGDDDGGNSGSGGGGDDGPDGDDD